MLKRSVLALAGLVLAFPAAAQELSAEQARHFVVGKTFAFTCFDGSRGVGRVRADGSVQGMVQVAGKGPVHRAHLPANTLRVKAGRVCASVNGMNMQPCFAIQRTSDSTFRGSIAGMGFAYCDFVRGRTRRTLRSADRKEGRNGPLALRAPAAE